MKTASPGSAGTAVLLFSAAVALLVALYAYATPLTGVTGTPGALLAVVVSIAIIFLTGLLPRSRPHASRAFWRAVLVILLAGNGFAGMLLHEWGLVIAMAVGFIGLVIDMLGKRRVSGRERHEAA